MGISYIKSFFIEILDYNMQKILHFILIFIYIRKIIPILMAAALYGTILNYLQLSFHKDKAYKNQTYCFY